MPEIIEDTTINDLFDRGYKLYEDGEPYENLIPLFKEVCDHSPKSSQAWSCMAWLYLLTDRGDLALKAAKRAIKADATAPQARINLVLAMLEMGEKGVREHIEIVQRINNVDQEVKQSVIDNITDGLTRKPDWKHLKKVKQWLEL